MGDVAADRSIHALRAALERESDPVRAAGAARYMRDQFPFLGVPMPVLRRCARPFVEAWRDATGDELLDVAEALWAEPERELQYAAVDLLRKRGGALSGDHLPRVARLIRSKSWWDTVDTLAVHVVGPIVAREPALAEVMDEWIDDEDVWIARTALLHQLSYRERTDVARLFGYVDRRASDTEYFIRKACGWALREHAKTDPEAVRGYLARRGDRLSGLTRREAAKHL